VKCIGWCLSFSELPVLFILRTECSKGPLTVKIYINIVAENKDVKRLESEEHHRGLLHYNSPFTRWSECLTVAFQKPITVFTFEHVSLLPSEAGFLYANAVVQLQH